jgi:hypothetical protein
MILAFTGQSAGFWTANGNLRIGHGFASNWYNYRPFSGFM